MDSLALLAKMTVVVAEDQKFSRSIVMGQIRDLGCPTVIPAGDGGEGLEQLGKLHHKPALLIADFNMPVCNGLQMLKSIRAHKTPVPHDLPVVMLTGHTDFGLVKSAMALDVDAFVMKPATMAILSARLAKILNEHRGIKAPAHYAGIDIDQISDLLLKPAQPPNTPPSPLVSGIEMSLEDIPVDSVLVEDIKAPNGELMLAAGTPLSARYLRRLKELSHAIKVERLMILPQVTAPSPA